MWPKLMSSSTNGKELSMAMHDRKNKTRSTLSVDVDEEYMQALRCKSYVAIWDKAHEQLRRTTTTTTITTTTRAQKEVEAEEEALASPFSHPHYSHLPDLLLEPVQQPLNSCSGFTGHFHLHTLLLDYFDATLQACAACASLLASIDRARSHRRSLLRLLRRLSSSPSSAAFAQLASLLELGNPLSPPNLAHFHRTHALLPPLVRRLSSAHRRIRRRIKLVRISKTTAGIALVAACGAVAMAALAVATQAVGLVPAALVVPPAAELWARRHARGLGELRLAAAGARADAAAKGAYIMAREFDTMSRMVRRADGEVEHGRDVGRMAARGRERQLVREAAREVERGESGLEEQLGELEEHVYLCLLTINRSRRLVADEMAAGSSRGAPPSPTASV